MTPSTRAQVRSSCIAVVLAAATACSDDGVPADEGSSSTVTTPSTSSSPSSTAPSDSTSADPTSATTQPGSTTADDTTTTVDPAADSSTTDAPPPSRGCGNAEAAAGQTDRTMQIQGVERGYIVRAPAVIDPEAPLALSFVFHGNGGDGAGIMGMGLQDAPGAEAQGVFVFPDGLPFKGFGVGWNGACDGYDMEFFDTMIAELSVEYCIDAERIFAAGFSWGGDMCQSLACCRGDIVRAIAPASGPEFYPSEYPKACPESARPAFRMTYADNDAYAPALFDEAVEWHRQEQGCDETPAPIDPEPCVAYSGCTEPVIACEYPGLGHAWPADWAATSWDFFMQLP